MAENVFGLANDDRPTDHGPRTTDRVHAIPALPIEVVDVTGQGSAQY
jgi:hypothetical protein